MFEDFVFVVIYENIIKFRFKIPENSMFFLIFLIHPSFNFRIKIPIRKKLTFLWKWAYWNLCRLIIDEFLRVITNSIIQTTLLDLPTTIMRIYFLIK